MKKMNLGLHGASLLSFVGVAALSTMTVHAANIDLSALGNGLYNTGVEVDDTTPIPIDPSGNNNASDTHYSVSYYINGADGHVPTVLPPAIYAPGYYGVADYTGPAYVAGPPALGWSSAAGSQWITYAPDMNNTVDVTPNTAVSVYELVLTDIPTGDQVTINGLVSGDDNVSVYADGKELFSNFDVNDDGFHSGAKYQDFAAFAGSFTSGANNTLDFVVYNNGGTPTGLNANLTGFYTTAVPEPSTYALLTASLGALLFLARRKVALS